MATENIESYRVVIENERVKFSTRNISLLATDDNVLRFCKAFNSLQDAPIKAITKISTYRLVKN
jgi:hypothetical protein